MVRGGPTGMVTLSSDKDYIRDIARSAHYLRLQEDHTDVVFHCKDGAAVHAHKAMFIGHSSFLSSLFLISAEKQSPSAVTEFSLPGVEETKLTKLLQYLYQGQTTLHSRQEKEHVLALSKTLGISLNLENVDKDNGDTELIPSEPKKASSSSLGRTKKQKPEKKIVSIAEETNKDEKTESKEDVEPKLEHATEDLAVGKSPSIQKTSRRVSFREKECGMNADDYDRALAFARKDLLKVRLLNCGKDHAEEVKNLSAKKTNYSENPLFDNSYVQTEENGTKDETFCKRGGQVRKTAKHNLELSDDEDIFSSKDDSELVYTSAKRIRSDEKETETVPRGAKEPKGKKGRKRKVAEPQSSDNEMAETSKIEQLDEEKATESKMEVSDPEDSDLDENKEKLEEKSKTNKKKDTAEKADSPDSREKEILHPANEPKIEILKSAKRRHVSGNDMASAEKNDLVIEEDKLEGETDDAKYEKPAKRGRKSSLKETAEKQPLRKQEESPDKEESDIDEEKEESGEEEEDYEVEKIIDKRGSGRSLEYLVKWKGWDQEEDLTWEPVKHLADVKKIVKEFEASLKTKSTPKRRGKGASQVSKKSKTVDKEDEKNSDAASRNPSGADKKDEPANNGDGNDETDDGCADMDEDGVESRPTMCEKDKRIFLSAKALRDHKKEDHGEKKNKRNKEKSGSSSSPSPAKQKHNISFSDSEEEPDTDIQEKLKNVGKTFDDLFGNDIAESSKKEKVVYNKDSDESEDEPEDTAAGGMVNELLDSD